jgi:hypothetical protein
VTYRKWGRVVRWENGVLVHVEEAGEAREENGVFVAAPIAEREALPDVDADRVIQIARSIGPAERVIVTEGVAIHECDGIRWREETHRVHVSLYKERIGRVLVDDAAQVARVRSVLARCGGYRADTRRRVRLMPHVAAALQFQCAYEQLPGGRDGAGKPIEYCRVKGEPPNVYRPSYRVRPVRKWLNVRPVPFGTIDRGAPEAVAVVHAPRSEGVLVLVDDGTKYSYVTPIRLDRVLAASEAGEVLL